MANANGECVSSHDYTNLFLLSYKYCHSLSYSLCIIIQNHANPIPQAYLAWVIFKEIESRATKIDDYCWATTYEDDFSEQSQLNNTTYAIFIIWILFSKSILKVS